jgi:signal transduction histidine kinase
MLHMDTKKLARIRRPGHRIHGDPSTRFYGIGWEYLHVAIDDHTRIAYAEVLRDGKANTSNRIQLKQVILNLIVNGIEAVSGVADGPRELVVGSASEVPDGVLGDRARFRRRGGCRDPRPPVRGVLHDQVRWHGHGLAICRSIIESHDRRIWATPNNPLGCGLPLQGASRRRCILSPGSASAACAADGEYGRGLFYRGTVTNWTAPSPPGRRRRSRR